MFKLNFKIALRNIWKNKTSSMINISGLAIGLAACLILLLYVSYEWGYDKQGANQDHVYQVMMNYENATGQIQETGWNTANVIAPLLKEKYPAVKAASRLTWASDELIANGQTSFKKGGVFADPDILNIFDYQFVYGNRQLALNAPNSIIVTESTARLLFGTTNVLNRTVRYKNKLDLKVTGVIKDLPPNVSRHLHYLMPWSVFESQFDWVKELSWGNYNYTTVVRLDPAVTAEEFNPQISDIYKKNAAWAKATLFLYPFNRLHLYGKFANGKGTDGGIEQLRLFMGLAIGILLIACVNFMNMATAKSERRAKEVGIKKTIGATRGSLINQFLMESMILTLLSTVVAIVLIEVCLPLFNNILDIRLGIMYSNPYLWIGLITVVLLTGFVAGSYPAFYLSSFNPVQILKKRNLKGGLLSVNLRQVLVVGQFSFAIVLIIATTVIYRQIQYIKNRPVGYAVNQLVEIPQDGELSGKFELLKTNLIRSGAVTSVIQSSATLTKQTSSFTGMEWPGSTEDDKLFSFNQLVTTYDFVKTTGVKLLYGRDFSRNFASDTAAMMISHAAMKRMNLKNPIGQIVNWHGTKTTIIGVFEDFILDSPFSIEKPLVVGFSKGWNGTVTMRLNPAHNAADNIVAVTKIVKEINPAYPADITFVDQLYAEKLKTQKVLGILSNLFGGLAIFISCLGLFGLAAYSAEQRTKEIGVRKVLGASVSGLMQLLSVSFLKMVFIAIVIAVPVASYLMNNWLKEFEFHTTISWLVVVLTAISTLGIALLTVSFQAYKAAKTNPVEALKYE